MVAVPKMPRLSGLKTDEAIDAAMAKVTADVEWHKKEAVLGTVFKKVLPDKQRSLAKGRARAALKQEKAAKKKKTKNTSKKNKFVQAKKGKGRTSKWPCRCLACVYRFLGRAGGPVHMRDLCGVTKREIAAKPRYVRKLFA